MKQALILGSILFAVALAVVVGQRLSVEAMSVVVGVVCGVAASVPVSLSLLFVLNRWPMAGGHRSSEEMVPRRDAPPVVVLNAGPVQPWPALGYNNAPAWPMSRPPGQERVFHIIGQEPEGETAWAVH
ncbi:MAG: hypothetical protein KKA73_26705 [Chloroflexi bacterium]|nr:hypothetical protein [Chloroflexota bacterium]MBU1751292.1 hypothetical protein [Chloroflexota bacterium]